MPDVSFGPLVSKFLFISCLLILTIILGIINIFSGWGVTWKAAATEMGPNDASCVVWAANWAISKCFLYFLSGFNLNKLTFTFRYDECL